MDFWMCDGSAEAAASGWRFEYRVWPREVVPAVARLQAHWPLAGAETRWDIYLEGPLSAGASVKLRHGRRLEIKRRGPDRGGLQVWRLALSRGFPLGASDLAQLAGALALGALPAEAGRTPSRLAAALEALDGSVRLVPVRKARLRFRRGSCTAEITRAGLGGARRMSVAIEDRDLASARRAVRDLGLGRLPNRSWEEVLQRAALPDADRLEDRRASH